MAKKQLEEVNEEIVWDPKELARAYVEQAILKIDGTHIDKQAIKPIVEQVLSFF